MYKHAAATLAMCASMAFINTEILAQTNADQFVVSITVEQDCAINVNDLNFGNVTDLAPATAATTTGTVTCTSINPVSVSFNPGTGGTSTFATRQMALGPETIDYNIYRDAAHTEILGDGTGGTFTIDFTSTGGADQFTIFGETVAAQTAKPPGTYTSTVTATVTF